MKYIIVLIIALFFSACTNKEDAENALMNEGMTNIKITGYSFFTCSKDDFYHTGFTAINSKGRKVEGTVCSGILFKGSTIRY